MFNSCLVGSTFANSRLVLGGEGSRNNLLLIASLVSSLCGMDAKDLLESLLNCCEIKAIKIIEVRLTRSSHLVKIFLLNSRNTALLC